MKTKLLIAAGAAMLLSACDVKDPIHDRELPEEGKIVLTTDWSQRGEGITVPERYHVHIGEAERQTFTEATNEHPGLFAPGTHRVLVYHDAAGITVNGNVATVAAATRAGEINSLPDWFFSHAADVVIEKGKVHEITAVMTQQVRQLTLTVEFTSEEFGNEFQSVAATLSGVAGTLDMESGTHGSPSSIAPIFTPTDDGKWTTTVRLLGVAGDEQKLTGTLDVGDGITLPFEYDLSADMADFNEGKKEPLALTVEIPISPDAATPLTVIDDAKYDIPAMTVGTTIAEIDLSKAVSGGTTPYTYSATGLPAGLSIDPATGVISGTPTAPIPAGTATITVTDNSDPQNSESIDIAFGEVSAASSVFVPVTSITGVQTAATAGTPLTLTGSVAPTTATNKTITWSLSDAGETGATITGNTFNATSAGTATITATIVNGATESTPYTQNFTITVSAAPPAFVPVTSITGVPTAATAETPLTLTGTVNPTTATNKTITWSVNNANGTDATITGDNTFNATSAGTATVTATVVNGLTETTPYTQNFTITVSAAPQPTPVITIDTQPKPVTNVTAGSITGALTVDASVTEGATLSYQWYSNTVSSNTGGTAVNDAIGTMFTIPTTLTAGDHYYYCVVSATGGAAAKTSDVAKVTVTAPTGPGIGGDIGDWNGGNDGEGTAN